MKSSSKTRVTQSLKALFISITSVLIISGCTMVPEQIDVAENQNLVSFETLSKDKSNNSVKGEKARWGGKIVSVTNKKDVSEIEIIYFPENRFGKPITGDESSGRFKAVVDGFIDPIVFEQGRLITVVGEVGDMQMDIIGEQEYQYPTLSAQGYYMWKESRAAEAYAFSPFFFRAGFHPGFFNPWYDPFWHRRYSSRFFFHNRFDRNHRRLSGYRHHGNQNTGRAQTSNSSSSDSTRRSVRRSQAATRDYTRTHRPVVKEK